MIQKDETQHKSMEMPRVLYEFLAIRYSRGKVALTRKALEEYTGLWKDQLALFLDEEEVRDDKKTVSKTEMVMRVLIGNSDNPLSIEEFEAEYYRYIDRKGYPADRLKINIRTVGNHLRNTKGIVFNRDNKVRYCSADPRVVWKTVDFGQYKNMVISSDLIFRDYQDVMEELDIRDGYELFYVIKSSISLWNEKLFPIHCRRVPVIVLGDASEEKQAIKLLKEISPVAYLDYYEAYEERYGLRKESAQGNPVISNAVGTYYIDGQYTIDAPAIDERDIVPFQKALSKRDIWFIEDIEEIFDSICVHTTHDANLPELGKHFQHESTGLFVSGIGGRGEIEFIMQQQNMYGFFALYHGITTMLRVGDFSLYEFGNGIVGIGEIKTRKNESCEKRIDIEAYISSKIDFNALKDIPQEKRHIILSPKKSTNRQHLESQLTLQDKLLIQKTADVAASQYGQFEYQLINQVATGNGISLNSDHSLLLLGVHSSHKKLFHILVTEDEHFEIPEGYAACAKKLIHPNAEYNRIIMGQLDTTMHHSRIPVFWWEINDQVCEDIYFKRLHIATAYNPCNIIQHFVELGYSVAETPNHCFSLINSDGGASLELCNFEMFFDLISHSLLKTQSVINIIDGAINELKTGKHGPNTRMDIDIQLHNFGGMPK